MKKILVGFLALSLVASCEKDVNLRLQEADPKLVVEATIENGQPPVVILSRSVGYFATLSPELLENSFVHQARVTVYHKGNQYALNEYSVQGAGGFRLYYYTTDSANGTPALLGELNQKYELAIDVNSRQYEASTAIPAYNKTVDSLWWAPAPGEPKKAVIKVKATDPPGFGDYIRYFTSINNGPFLPPANAVFDDLFVDGTTYELQLAPGYNRNAEDKRSFLFNRGDTVRFKLSSIDKATYEFWRTMEYSYASVGNPFASPIKVTGNISNGALGYFGGYASQYFTIIIPQ